MGNCMCGSGEGSGPCPWRKAGPFEGTDGDLTFSENMVRERKGEDVFRYYVKVTSDDGLRRSFGADDGAMIGEGSIGAVYRVRKRNAAAGGIGPVERVLMPFRRRKRDGGDAGPRPAPGREYALKTIQLGRVEDWAVKELRNEVMILRSLDHPHIARAYEVFEGRRQIYMVMELCSGGDPYARAPYTEREAANITAQLLSALAYMHGKNICHRDLKFENILFESEAPDANIKVIDFGLGARYIPGCKMTRGVGTLYTMAPQVLQKVYTSQADLWSTGVIAFMLISGSKPFPQRRRRKLIDAIMRCDYNFNGRRWKFVSNDAKDFVSSLIKLDPKERLTAKQALEHKWLTKEALLSDRRPPEEFMDNVHGNMTNFFKASEFKKMALMVLAHNSSMDEILDLRNAFGQFDTSNDGEISLAEFKAAVVKLHCTEEEAESLFNGVDVDHSGTINYTEFLAATLEAHGRIQEDRLAEAFDMIDADHTGYISKENLQKLLGSSYAQEQVNNMFEEADIDDSGQISFQEFLRVVRGEHEKIVDCANCTSTGEAEAEAGSGGSPLLTISAQIPGGRNEG